MFNFIKNISPIELGAIALIIIVLFGAGLMKKLARTGGESLKEVKKINKNFKEAISDDTSKTVKD